MGEPTVVKAYQVLRAIMNTAVDDELIQRNPCRVKGAGAAKTAERPFLEVSEVFRLADAVPARSRGDADGWHRGEDAQERGRRAHGGLPGLADGGAGRSSRRVRRAWPHRAGVHRARGGQLRRNNFRRLWLRALKTTGLGDVHFHDLRHTGNTLAATGGATTRELMQRMGHSSVRAALIYPHLVNGRDQAIAAHVDEQIKKVRPAKPSEEGSMSRPESSRF
ncbi:site-specific integrase [Streptomyces sp. PmtA]|uniref:site-specific integrase n=1 Tax=Streptomyces sp. PmtA TaxID=3074275 RepID=UPI003014335A